MRKIDWDKALSNEDIAWLRQAGIMSEEQIARHQEQHKAEVPEEDIPDDETTKDALSAARVRERVVTGDGPVEVDPTQSGPDAEEVVVEDDYDDWKVKELEDEVVARDGMADTTRVVVEPTGANGKVLKQDLIKALRVWDDENPGALKD